MRRRLGCAAHHRCTRGGADTGGRDADAGGEEIHAAPVVGPRWRDVALVGRCDGDDRGASGWADLAGGRTIVACRGDDGDPVVDDGLGGSIDAAAHNASHAHVRDRRLTGGVVDLDPGEPVDHARRATGTVTSHHAHRSKRDLLRHSIRRSTEQCCDVGSVPVAVLGAATDCVVSGKNSASQVRVVRADSAVDYIRSHAWASSLLGKRARERQVPLVDAIQSPRRR